MQANVRPGLRQRHCNCGAESTAGAGYKHILAIKPKAIEDHIKVIRRWRVRDAA